MLRSPAERTRASCLVAVVIGAAACGSAAADDGFDAQAGTSADTSAGTGGAASAAGVGGAGGATGGSTSTGQGGDGGDGGKTLEAPWGWGLPCAANGHPGTCMSTSACTGTSAPNPGHCPGPADFQCCIDTGGTCDPEAAPLPNVGLDEAPGIAGCPAGMTPVDDFCVDVFEASLVFASDGASFSPYVNPGAQAVRAVSIEGAVPQGYIHQAQADDACFAAGKRLCTDTEWLRACQGPSGTTYPYGDAPIDGLCNDARAQHPAVEYFGTSDAWIYAELGNACLNQLPASLDPAGASPGCVTDDGLFDMMGNLHEWTADPNGTFRGGFYVDTKLNGPGCLYKTTAHDTQHWDYSTGFRCCADP